MIGLVRQFSLHFFYVVEKVEHDAISRQNTSVE